MRSDAGKKAEGLRIIAKIARANGVSITVRELDKMVESPSSRELVAKRVPSPSPPPASRPRVNRYDISGARLDHLLPSRLRRSARHLCPLQTLQPGFDLLPSLALQRGLAIGAVITIVLAYIWCANNVVYVGISFNTENFGGSPYLVFLLLSLVEIASNGFNFIVNYTGR